MADTSSFGLRQLERVVLRLVGMRLKTPFVTGLGEELERRIIIVEVHADGVVGYGEAPVLAAPTYNEETAATAWHVLNDFFIPRVFDYGRRRGGGGGEPELLSPRAVARELAMFKGHAFAKAGLEGAVWDAAAKAAGVPLSRLLRQVSAAGGDGAAGDGADRILSGVVVGMPEPGAGAEGRLLKQVEARLREGYRRIKIKIGPERDRELLAAVRRTFGSVPLSVDANGGYGPGDEDVFRALDDFGLDYIEQPFPAFDLLGHQKLQRALKTPLCLDESIGGEGEARQALDAGGCRVVNVKASRVGGLSAAVAIHDLCRHRGVPALGGGLLESGIGRAHAVALASLPGFTLPADLSASDRYWERDVVSPAFTLDDDGCLPVPDGPGIGVEVDTPYLEQLTLRKRVHRFA